MLDQLLNGTDMESEKSCADLQTSIHVNPESGAAGHTCFSAFVSIQGPPHYQINVMSRAFQDNLCSPCGLLILQTTLG